MAATLSSRWEIGWGWRHKSFLLKFTCVNKWFSNRGDLEAFGTRIFLSGVNMLSRIWNGGPSGPTVDQEDKTFARSRGH